MASKRIGIYIDDALLEWLNQATVGSLQSRSEIVCQAIEHYLAGAQRPAEATLDRRGLRERVSQLFASGLLQVDDFDQEWPKAKNKPWIH